MVNIMQKYGQKIKVNQQQVNINVYVRCFTITVVQEMYEGFEKLIYLCTEL